MFPYHTVQITLPSRIPVTPLRAPRISSQSIEYLAGWLKNKKSNVQKFFRDYVKIRSSSGSSSSTHRIFSNPLNYHCVTHSLLSSNIYSDNGGMHVVRCYRLIHWIIITTRIFYPSIRVAVDARMNLRLSRDAAAHTDFRVTPIGNECANKFNRIALATSAAIKGPKSGFNLFLIVIIQQARASTTTRHVNFPSPR